MWRIIADILMIIGGLLGGSLWFGISGQFVPLATPYYVLSPVIIPLDSIPFSLDLLIGILEVEV